jgi:hypothetical protein
MGELKEKVAAEVLRRAAKRNAVPPA